MRGRKTLCICILITLCMLFAIPASASASSWKSVKPTARFVKYAKHARSHGMQAWYPRRLPTGFKLKSMTFGDMGDAGPYCDIVFRKGSKRIDLNQGTIVGADGEGPAPTGRVKWGSAKADIFAGGWITWWGRHNAFAQISGSGVTGSQKRTVAKYMRKVP